MANGFHNAPASFFHDHTVRVRDNITGFGSGVVVGCQEFGLGLYDALSGVVTQPYLGYKEASDTNGSSLIGATKGVGRGLAGLVFKTGAAVLGPPAYSLKGLEREIQRWWEGTDRLNGSEIAAIQKVKEGARNAGLGTGDGKHAAQLMWEEAKGAGVGKRIVERRVWQGYREVNVLRTQGEQGAMLELEILENWAKLGLDDGFLRGLMP